MKKIQVLVATVGQKDDSIAEKMNLRCDVIVANQADRNEVTERTAENGTIRMITTQTRGVGLNRNIALLAADAEILLFADDDMTYRDNAVQGVYESFQRNPAADMMIFGVDIRKDGQILERRRNKPGRVPLWQTMKYGTYALAVRADALRRANISFHLLFGGGTVYGSGEDTLFIRECFRKGLRVYRSDHVLGERCKDSSTWFRGYDEKFFFDKGALYACAFPWMKYFVAMYFSWRFAKKTDLPVWKIYRTMCSGFRAFVLGKSYDDWKRRNG